MSNIPSELYSKLVKVAIDHHAGSVIAEDAVQVNVIPFDNIDGLRIEKRDSAKGENGYKHDNPEIVIRLKGGKENIIIHPDEQQLTALIESYESALAASRSHATRTGDRTTTPARGAAA